MKIGDNIREIREEKGVKKEDISKALGITTKAYSNIENNVTDITLTRLAEIAEIFECAPEYILRYHDKDSYANYFYNYNGNQGINIMFQGCSPDQVKNIREELEKSNDKLESLKNFVRVKEN